MEEYSKEKTKSTLQEINYTKHKIIRFLKSIFTSIGILLIVFVVHVLFGMSVSPLEMSGVLLLMILGYFYSFYIDEKDFTNKLSEENRKVYNSYKFNKRLSTRIKKLFSKNQSKEVK